MGQYWSLEAVQHLRHLVEEKAPVSVIAMMMRRDAGDVHAKLNELGLSAPMDESPDESASQETSRRDSEAGRSEGRREQAGQSEPGSASF